MRVLLVERNSPERGELERALLIAGTDQRAVQLTRTEFELLHLFMRNPRRVLPHEPIYERVWGYDFALRLRGRARGGKRFSESPLVQGSKCT